MRSAALYLSGLLPQRLDGDPRCRTPSNLGVGPSASSPVSHVKGAQEQKCLLGEQCRQHRLSRRRGEGMEGKGLEWIMGVQFVCSFICFGICYLQQLCFEISASSYDHHVFSEEFFSLFLLMVSNRTLQREPLLWASLWFSKNEQSRQKPLSLLFYTSALTL